MSSTFRTIRSSDIEGLAPFRNVSVSRTADGIWKIEDSLMLNVASEAESIELAVERFVKRCDEMQESIREAIQFLKGELAKLQAQKAFFREINDFMKFNAMEGQSRLKMISDLEEKILMIDAIKTDDVVKIIPYFETLRSDKQMVNDKMIK